MKKTLANIRTLAALLIASAAFTACTSEDSAIIDNAQPAAQQAPQVYTLTLQAGKTDGAGTRALKLETLGDLTAYWADGDVVTVTKGETALGTLSVKEGSVSADGQTCTFTGELTGTVSTGDVLTLTYHPMASLAAFGSQNGQLGSAAACDMATASVTVTAVDDGTKTITVGTAKFKTQTAMLKITLQDTGGHDLNASSLTISAGGTEIFTLTSIAVVGTLYLALPSAERVATAMSTTTEALAALPITFSATAGGETYVATKTGYPFAAGKYYTTTLTMAKALTYPIALSAVTADYVGSVVTTDGNVCAKVSDANTAGKTAVAMIAYVGNASDCTNGLAIALADESDSKMDWSTAKSTCEGKTAITGGTWRLPSAKDWQYMFIGCGSDESYSDPSEEMKRSYSGLASKLTTAGGTALRAGEDYNYWLSSEYDISHAWSLRFVGSDAIFLFGSEDLGAFVRAGLAF